MQLPFLFVKTLFLPFVTMTALAGQIAEIWILYVIGTAMIAARIFCRTKMVGYRNYDWDDYLVIAVAVSLHSMTDVFNN